MTTIIMRVTKNKLFYFDSISIMFQPLQKINLKSVMDIDKCHLCKLDNNHTPRPADNFDLILHGITTDFMANVGVTVFAALDQNDSQCMFEEYNSISTITLTTKQVCMSCIIPCNMVVLVKRYLTT